MTGLKVLFANDDVLTQWIMSDVLGKTGFNVTSVCRSQRISEMLAAGCEFDLLLLDLQLPDLAESGMVRQWRSALVHRPIIYTGPNRGGLLRTLERDESFLPSPFSAGALLQAIEDAVDESWLLPLMPEAVRYHSHLH